MENYITEKICPICHNKVTSSDYLESIFKDNPKVNYLAHLITHYRHNHIQSWNRCWGLYGGRYRQNWFGDYDEEKRKVNERAKRQLIRKGHKIFIACGITPNDFLSLQNTDEKTMYLANKMLVNSNVYALPNNKKRTLATRRRSIKSEQ